MAVGVDLAKLVLVTFRAKLVLVTYRSHYLPLADVIVDHRLRFCILSFLSFAYFISISQMIIDLSTRTYTYPILDLRILYTMVDNRLPMTNQSFIYD